MKAPRKVFQIGFSHCGTHSIHKLFEDSGVEGCAHYTDPKTGFHLAITMDKNIKDGKPILSGIEHLSVFTDMQYRPPSDYGKLYEYVDFFKKFKEIDRRVPDSLFIANMRPVEKWIKTRETAEIKLGSTISLLEDYDLESWRRGKADEFFDHYGDIRSFSSIRDRLIFFNIEKGPEDLIKFFADYGFDLNPKMWGRYNKTIGQGS